MKALIKKIIVAVNGSKQSEHAALYSILFAKQYKCELKAVYVVDTASLKQLTLGNFFYKEESLKYEQNLENDGEKYLKEVENLAKSKGIKIQTELRKGSPWSEIIKSAEDFDADLIILGGKEHTSPSVSLIHDSASATNMDIVGNANCNVFVVRQNDVEKLFKLS